MYISTANMAKYWQLASLDNGCKWNLMIIVCCLDTIFHITMQGNENKYAWVIENTLGENRQWPLMGIGFPSEVEKWMYTNHPLYTVNG